MKKIIALGGKGMTGFYLPEDMPNYDLVDGYDITIPGLLEKIFEDEKPDVVINLAAITDVVGAETDRERCYEVNAIAAQRVMELCAKYNAGLIFISSVDVFDGEKDLPYTKFDQRNPIVVYGRSKYLAENMVYWLRGANPVLIIRAGWMFGGFERDKKFVSYMMEQMKSGQPVIKAVSDIHGSPTYAKDLIAFVLETATTDFESDIIHFCNKGAATRYDQACLIADTLGYEGEVIPANMSDFPKFRALKNSVMESSVTTRSWQDALTEYITLWKERIK